MQDKREIAIVGGGMLGMTLAYRLRQAGHEVTLIEAETSLGGQTGVWDIGGVVWDKHYHIISPQDDYLLALLDELGMSGDIIWSPTKTGFYANKQLYSLSGIADFLSFPVISLLDKARLALTILRAYSIRDTRSFETMTSLEWLEKWSGTNNCRVLWRPLLRSKFGEEYAQLSAAFIISTIRRMYGARQGNAKQEMFGYVRGGYKNILEGFLQALTHTGVNVWPGSPVERITSEAKGVKIQIKNKAECAFDSVILTIAPPLAHRICQQPLEQPQRPYLGIICASFLYNRPLSDYYITNILEEWVPFTGVIEMTALVDKAEFNGQSLIYLPRYVNSDDALFSKSDAELESHYRSVLQEMYPDFKPDNITGFKISRVPYVMSVPLKGRPALTKHLLCPGVYMLNTGHIGDGVLTVNKMIGLAEIFLEKEGGKI